MTERPFIRVVGFDPGLAHLGIAEADLYADGMLVPMALDLVTTTKSAKKFKVLAGDDDFRRSIEVAKRVSGPFSRAKAITTEGASWPRNNRSCQLIGRSWGILATFVVQHDLPVASASPQAIKKVLCGRMQASKEEVQTELDRRFPGLRDLLPSGITKDEIEHPYDALGSIVACLDSDVLKMARQLAV